jgi:hypothetical protein
MTRIRTPATPAEDKSRLPASTMQSPRVSEAALKVNMQRLMQGT